MQGCRATKQAKCGYHPDEPETVVAMQMRNKHCSYLRETNVRATQLNLRPFATIYHKEFATDVYHLRCGIMFQRWQRTATTQDMNFKRLQGRIIFGV